jgi:type I restriction enzyme R subunit
MVRRLDLIAEAQMQSEFIRRRDLPHWDVDGAAYFVTTCLKASIPAKGVREITRFRDELQGRPQPVDMSRAGWESLRWKMNFARVEHWLDREAANRALEQSNLAEVVVNSMLYFAGQRYDLLAYVVMPSHMHWVFQPLPEWTRNLPADGPSAREKIMYSLKRFIANACNRLLQRRGTFWQAESYDHWIRDADEMDRIIRYVENNPVKACLVDQPEDWPYSSAHARKVAQAEWGVPLCGETSGSES